MLLACTAACTAGHAGGDAQASVLPVVTWTPKGEVAIPADLIEASPFRRGVSVRSGFACFTLGGVPVEWPAGYAAVKGADGTLEARDNTGHLIRPARAQFLSVYNTTQTAPNACSGTGDMTVILSLQKSA
jgi:hypothetical protein